MKTNRNNLFFAYSGNREYLLFVLRRILVYTKSTYGGGGEILKRGRDGPLEVRGGG